MELSISTYLKLLYDSVRFPIQVIDEDGYIIYVNQEFSNQWGYDTGELNEYSAFSDAELKRNGSLDRIKEVFKNKTSVVFDNYVDSFLLNRDSAIPLFKTTLIHIEHDGKSYVVLTHLDQTEIILAEEEVKKARDANSEAERLKNTFLNVLSHELRTPLNIILGYTTIIKENLKDKISSEDKIYLDNLYIGAERLFKSITQMLEFAQIEAGSFKLNFDTIDLINVFKNCIIPYKKRAMERQLDFKTHFGDEPVYVEIDLQCTESVINSLLDNSVKFTQQGFIDVEIRVLEDRDLAVCKIKDTGVGISTDYLDHLYRPFSQEDLDVGRSYEGNGLGLALSKRYVEKMGGSLIVDSIKGVGTTITFTIPLAKSSKVMQLRKATEKTLNGNSKILMLDDAGESFELVKAFLKEDYDVKLLKYHEFDPDNIINDDFQLLIFDVAKNFWDRGIELCRKIKSHDAVNRPVVILSSEFMNDKINQFYNAGADEFLVKPFARNDLVNLLEKITS